MARHARRAAAVATVLLGLGTASPAAANFLAVGEDPVGDAADPHPARDIVAVAFSYDRRTGHLRGGVRLGGAPSGDAAANLTIFAGHKTATGCNGYPAIGFGTQTDLTGAAWVRLDAPGAQPGATGRATKVYEAEAEEYEATARALAGKRPDCVIAQLNQPGDTAVVYDTAGPFALRGLPELDARLGKLPSRLQPGQTRTVRATLRNLGDASTGRVRLAASKARGLTVRLPRTVPALRAGARRTVALTVTLSSRARTSTTLRLTATGAGGVRARDEGRLYLRKPAPAGGGGGTSGKLCFRYTWLPPYSTLVPC